MTKEQRDKLRTLALAATPGEWEQKNTTDVFGPLAGDSGDGTMADSSDAWLIADCNVGLTSVNGELAVMDVKIQRRNAAYIAAANPATLLALLDRIDELEGDIDLPEIKTIGRAMLRVNRINNLEPPTERAVPEITGDTSDGYHTFNELYEFRKVYNAALFNEWAAAGKYNVHKSWRHHDGEECFGGGWFIVVAMLPTGQISNHYAAEDWGLFNVPECERAKFEFDGHTSEDVLLRLKSLAAAPGAGGE